MRSFSRYSLSWIGLVLSLWFSPALAQSGRQLVRPSGPPARQSRNHVLRIPTTEVQLAVTVRDSLEEIPTSASATQFQV